MNFPRHSGRRGRLAGLTFSLLIGCGGIGGTVRADDTVIPLPSLHPDLAGHHAPERARNTAESPSSPDRANGDVPQDQPIPGAGPPGTPVVSPKSDSGPRPAPPQSNGKKVRPTAPVAPTRPGPIAVQKFEHLQWSPEGNYLHAQGHVQVVYTDPATNKRSTLTTENLDYNAATGIVTAKGTVRLEREEGTFTGQELSYNFQTGAGYVTEAEVVTDQFRVRGTRLEALDQDTYVVTNGVFTTCKNGRPDYQIHARKLTVVRNRFVKAQGITFYLGPTAVFAWPSYHKNLQKASSAPLPLPGYDKTDGVYVRLRDSLIEQPNRLLNYDARVNARTFPAGFFAYQNDLTPTSSRMLPPHDLLPNLTDPLRGILEQSTPPTYGEYTDSLYTQPYERRTTFYAVLANRLGAYNRNATNLAVSRYPEVGVRFGNLLGHNPPEPAAAEMEPGEPTEPPVPIGDTESALRRVPNTPLLLNVFASLGEINERQILDVNDRTITTNITSGRFATRAELATQPMLMGKRLSWRVGLTNWFNVYSSGSAYELIAPEVGLYYVPTRTSLFNVGYRYLDHSGSTPFTFDRQDIRNDLHVQYQVGGPWAFGVVVRYDLGDFHSYDSELSAVRNFDCMQVGLTFRLRTQSIGLIFNILPPGRSRPLSPIRSVSW